MNYEPTNPERAARPDPSLSRKLGEGVVAFTAAYLGGKTAQALGNYDFPLSKDIVLAGTTTTLYYFAKNIKARYRATDQSNTPPEH